MTNTVKVGSDELADPQVNDSTASQVLVLEEDLVLVSWQPQAWFHLQWHSFTFWRENKT